LSPPPSLASLLQTKLPKGSVTETFISGNVWRDRLIGAIAHGDGGCDWAVMAREQARTSGLAS
jgi:hypothetical protein